MCLRTMPGARVNHADSGSNNDAHPEPPMGRWLATKRNLSIGRYRGGHRLALDLDARGLSFQSPNRNDGNSVVESVADKESVLP